MNYKSLMKPFFLWSILTLFFAWQFIMRLFVGVIKEDIFVRFNINTIDFGSFAAMYYWGYSGMLIPLGFLLDKYNFRYVTACAIFIAAFFMYIMNLTNNWDIVLLSRFFVGAGSAVAFLSVAKSIKLFFPDKMHSILIGFSFTFGLIGAVFSGNPTKEFYLTYGYESTFLMISSVAVAIDVVILLVSDKKVDRVEDESTSIVTIPKTIKLIFNPKILIIGLLGGLMVGSLEGFADFWGKQYLTQVGNYSDTDAISVVFSIYIGLCIGGPILSALSEIFNSKIFFIILTALISVFIFWILFHYLPAPGLYAKFLMILLGITCCYQVLIFTLTTDLVDRSWAGMAIAIVNCLNMLFGSFFHKIIPFLMVKYSSDEVNTMNFPIYTEETYIKVLSIIPILAFIGAIGFVYLSSLMRRGKLSKINLEK